MQKTIRRMFMSAGFIGGSLFLTAAVDAGQVIEIKPGDGDMTPVLRAALDGVTDPDVKLVFSKGVYRFLPDKAFGKYCTITNHGNGMKRIIFPFEGLRSVEIEGNGAEFLFHGQVLPFLFEKCGKVTARDFTIDWDIPFIFQGAVLATDPKEEWMDLKPMTNGFSWKLADNRVLFPNIDGFNYAMVGSSLAFDPKTKRVVHGAHDFESNPRWVEKRPGGVLRFHEPLKHYPPVGSVLTSKGEREQDRYAPAIHVKSSKDIRFEGVVVHHALGMGFLMERSENAVLSKCGVYLRDGTDRLISSTADATHFANCKGDILVEDCRFENMLDDGTNVHGTYVEVDGIVDDHTVRIGLKHFEQLGFEFAGVGDAIWMIHSPSPARAAQNEVVSVKVINERFTELRFKDRLSDNLAVGDVLENKTWNPTFTMRGCTIRNHRARNVVLKSPLKTVIENNDFSSMMSSIFFRGETFFWFESGAVIDVLIRNNRFEYCAYSGIEHAVLTITPRLGSSFNQDESYDRNIRFESNTINTFDSRIVWADRVDGLVIDGNKIKRTGNAEPLYPDAAQFDFANCRNVRITNNTYEGAEPKPVSADAATRASMTIEGNTGFLQTQ